MVGNALVKNLKREGWVDTYISPLTWVDIYISTKRYITQGWVDIFVSNKIYYLYFYFLLAGTMWHQFWTQTLLSMNSSSLSDFGTIYSKTKNQHLFYNHSLQLPKQSLFLKSMLLITRHWLFFSKGIPSSHLSRLLQIIQSSLQRYLLKVKAATQWTILKSWKFICNMAKYFQKWKLQKVAKTTFQMSRQ